MTEAHLVSIRSHLNAHAAWESLWPSKDSPGRPGYSTFARAFRNMPAPIKAGVMEGWDGMMAHHVYLPMTAPHRNHTWHLDHTQADLWVTIPRYQDPIRPWVSIVRDNATSAKLTAVAYTGRPNEETIRDTLATAAQPETYDLNGEEVVVGGVPVQLVFDNAKEHFAEAIRQGALMMGTFIAPTKAYHKWQNGPAEATFNGLNRQLLAGLPGYTGGGKNDHGQPSFVDSNPSKIDPAKVLTIKQFQKELDRWRIHTNLTSSLTRLGNQSPLAAWHDDPTELEILSDATFRAMMMRTAKGRVVNGEGIHWRGIYYTAGELSSYRERGYFLDVRYLNRENRFIEVFDGDTHVCRAWDRNLLTDEQRRQILGVRGRNVAFQNRVDASALQDRLHRKVTDDAEAYDDDTQDWPIDVTGLELVPDDAPEKPLESGGFTPPDLPARSLTEPTARRSKRMRAPAKNSQEMRKRDKALETSRDRISTRPNTAFGENK
ncbi:MAG: DDE-type integrase/transposase/recombinase [Phycicoccus sp.]|nr:DDE-type integrase/transposase/recombinase [Phycicoccus sp.]